MRKHDVIIVGGGIGGSTCAYFCQKAGLNVLMVEKEQFPRDKVCGDGLQAPMMSILEEMGILDQVLGASYINNGVAYVNAYDNRVLIPYEPPMTVHYSCPRYIYDNIINKFVVSTGIDYMENFEALELLKRRNQVYGVRGLYNGSIMDLEANLVILASGSHSMLARQAGFYEEDPDYVFYGLRGYFDNVGGIGDEEEFHYPVHFRDGSYIWLFPEADCANGTKRCNVGVFITEANLKDWNMTTEEILYWWRDNTKYGQERLKDAKLVGELKGWRLPTGKRQPVHAGGLIAVGDSGNMIDQCWGGGAGAAMTSGKMAAQIAAQAVEANDFSEKFLRKYEDAVEGSLGEFYKACQISREYMFKDEEVTRNYLDFLKKGAQGGMDAYFDSIGIKVDVKPPYSK